MTNFGGNGPSDDVCVSLSGDSGHNAFCLLFNMDGVVLQVVLGLFGSCDIEFIGGSSIKFFFASIDVQRVARRTVGGVELLAHPAGADKLPGFANNDGPAENRDYQQGQNRAEPFLGEVLPREPQGMA